MIIHGRWSVVERVVLIVCEDERGLVGLRKWKTNVLRMVLIIHYFRVNAAGAVWAVKRVVGIQGDGRGDQDVMVVVLSEHGQPGILGQVNKIRGDEKVSPKFYEAALSTPRSSINTPPIVPLSPVSRSSGGNKPWDMKQRSLGTAQLFVSVHCLSMWLLSTDGPLASYIDSGDNEQDCVPSRSPLRGTSTSAYDASDCPTTSRPATRRL